MQAPTDDDALFDLAEAAGANAHAPFSRYHVGAAVLDDQGNVHVGCNVENASYPEGICAEANAIGSMVAAGGRRIVSIAITGGFAGEPDEDAVNRFTSVGSCTPCGGCRQRILEFADGQTRILLRDPAGALQVCGIDDLLPNSFRLGD